MKKYLFSYHFATKTSNGFGNVDIETNDLSMENIRKIEKDLVKRYPGCTGVIILNIVPLEVDNA